MICGAGAERNSISVQEEIAVEDGEEAAKIANAKNFLRMNLGSPEQIAQGTGLPLEQVLALKEELEQQKAQVVL